MRIMLVLPISALALAGCGGGGDSAALAQMRTEGVESCIQQTRGQPLPPGLDVRQLCNCSFDRVMRGKTVAQMQSMPQAEATRQGAEAGAACARELMGANAEGAQSNSSR